MKNIMNKKYVFALILFSLLMLPMAPLAHASTASDIRTLTGINDADLGLGRQGLETTIQDIIGIILGFLGLIAVVIILIGGFMWMTAGGNEERVKKGRQFIINGVIGLVIILAAYAIAKFVIENLQTATGA